jgi:hypothetical protein
MFYDQNVCLLQDWMTLALVLLAWRLSLVLAQGRSSFSFIYSILNIFDCSPVVYLAPLTGFEFMCPFPISPHNQPRFRPCGVAITVPGWPCPILPRTPPDLLLVVRHSLWWTRTHVRVSACTASHLCVLNHSCLSKTVTYIHILSGTCTNTWVFSPFPDDPHTVTETCSSIVGVVRQIWNQLGLFLFSAVVQFIFL